MGNLHFPWLEMSILVPLVGALIVANLRSLVRVQQVSVAVCGLALALAIGEWIDFSMIGSFRAHDSFDVINWLFHRETFVVDELSAPLLPLGALLHFVTVLATSRARLDRSWYTRTLLAESILLTILSMQASWPLVIMLCISTLPVGIEMAGRRHSIRVYVLHMCLFIVLLLSGYAVFRMHWGTTANIVAGGLLTAAALLRSGIVPLHCWMTDMFEKASFGTALLNVTPLIGAYAVMRFVLPTAPSWGLHSIAFVSTLTALYAAGMASVQHEARRFFCYLFLSNASLVLVGLELVTPIGLAGALCVWLSVSLSLTGFALVLRAVESRIGRVSLDDYHGLYRQMPTLAAFFLLTGLASIGFPGTIGFIAIEMLVEGAVVISPLVCFAIVVVTAINGIAVVSAYMRIFTGKIPAAHVRLKTRPQERIAVSMMTALILGGGLLPQFGVSSRYHAAKELLQQRNEALEPGLDTPIATHTMPK